MVKTLNIPEESFHYTYQRSKMLPVSKELPLIIVPKSFKQSRKRMQKVLVCISHNIYDEMLAVTCTSLGYIRVGKDFFKL